jgi:U4/U6.U5 tri-snRNP component SNU23
MYLPSYLRETNQLDSFGTCDRQTSSYTHNFVGSYLDSAITINMAGVRRTWDKEYYAQKAKERLEAGDESTETETKKTSSIAHREEFKPADKDAAGPMGSDRAFLNARQSKIDLDEKVGKVEIIKPGEANSNHGPGFWCEVCQSLLRDSTSYLNHINGKNHQRALGYSMRVERVDADRVKERLEALKRKASAIEAPKAKDKQAAITEYDLRIAERVLEEEMEKKRRKEEKLQKQREQKEKELEDNQVDADIASMMGFGGFGSSKTK